MSSDVEIYEVKPFSKGQMIFKEGHIAKTAFLVKTGAVEIYRIINNMHVVLAELKEGQIFGEMGVISGESRTANARASEYSEIVVINKEILNHVLEEAPKIVNVLTRSLIERLKKTTKMVPEQHFSNVFMSVCNIIGTLNSSKRNNSATTSQQKPDSQTDLNYEDVSKKIKEIILISQFEIDTIVKRLRSINLLDIDYSSESSSNIKSIKVCDRENFIKISKRFYEDWKSIMPFSTSEQEFIDINDFAKLVNSTSEMIHKKIGAGEIPENMFFVNKAAVSAWIKEVGEDFFKTVKRRGKELKTKSEGPKRT
jgi:CRP-like cAMP-binding protein